MKIWNFMMIMLTMMIFLYFLGFNPAGTSDIMGDTGIVINSTTGELVEGDVSNSLWYDFLFNKDNGLIVAAGLSTALIVGLYTRQFQWKLVLLTFFTAFVIKFATFGAGIMFLAKDTGEQWLIAIVATIFLPLTVMFVYSLVEWFGGGGSGG